MSRPKLSSTNLILPATTTGAEPASAETGSLAYNDTTNQPIYKDAAGVWQNMGGGSSGAAGGDLAGTYPNPTVAAIHETAGPTKLTIGAIPDGDVLVRSGATVIGKTFKSFLYPTGEIPLWVPPASLGLTPDAFDAEMDSDPSWSYWDNTNSAARTPAGTPSFSAASSTVTTAVPALSFGLRTSHAVLQPPSPAAGTYDCMYYNPTAQTWAAASPRWYWARVNFAAVNSGGDSRLMLGLFGVTSGHPSRADCHLLGLYNTGGGMRFGAWVYTANVLADVGSTLGSADSTQDWNRGYLGFQIDDGATIAATKLNYWFFNDDGRSAIKGTVGLNTSLTSYYVGFYMRASAQPATGPQQNILDTDFVRKLPGLSPPWWR